MLQLTQSQPHLVLLQDTEQLRILSMNVPSVKQSKKIARRSKMKTFKSGIKKVVFLQGTFDIINWGHIKAFQRARKFGDYLIVALNSNELVKEYKKRDPVLPYYQKKFIIESCVFVDKVVMAKEFSPMELLKKYKVDVYIITEEWRDSKSVEIAYIKSKGGEIRISPRFKGVVCTSDIKKILLKEAKESD
jgi:D-beta-D-heptose 7-phosphate kinase/D-beta-D-heptose 1-phosphate adenosyltransferase